MDEKRHFYIAVRSDLTLPQQMCQAVHAAHEAGIRWGDPKSVSSVVVIMVANEEQLKKMQDGLEHRRIQSCLFHEPDLGGQATALGTEPLDQRSRKILSGYPLWSFPQEEVPKT